jgi:hypothetical protein
MRCTVRRGRAAVIDYDDDRRELRYTPLTLTYEESVQVEYEWTRKSTRLADIAEELGEDEELLKLIIEARDPNAIGRRVMATMHAYWDRCARRVVEA